MLLPQHHITSLPTWLYSLICQTRLPGDPCGKGEGCLGRTVTGQGTWTSKASYTLPTALKKGFHSWLSDVYWKVQSNLASRCPISMIARRNECVQLLAKINLYIFYTYYIIWHIIWCYIQWCLKCQKTAGADHRGWFHTHWGSEKPPWLKPRQSNDARSDKGKCWPSQNLCPKYVKVQFALLCSQRSVHKA